MLALLLHLSSLHLFHSVVTIMSMVGSSLWLGLFGIPLMESILATWPTKMSLKAMSEVSHLRMTESSGNEKKTAPTSLLALLVITGLRWVLKHLYWFGRDWEQGLCQRQVLAWAESSAAIH